MLKYFSFLLMLVFSYISIACDCQELSIKDAWDSTNVVFTCKVLNVNDNSGIYSGGVKIGYANVRISERFKGMRYLPDTITILNFKSDCDYNFQKDSTYIVYGCLYVGGVFISTTKCSGTKLLIDAEKDLKYIKELLQNKPVLNHGSGNISPPPLPILIDTENNYKR